MIFGFRFYDFLLFACVIPGPHHFTSVSPFSCVVRLAIYEHHEKRSLSTNLTSIRHILNLYFAVISKVEGLKITDEFAVWIIILGGFSVLSDFYFGFSVLMDSAF